MQLIKWDDKFVMGLKEVDDQHEHLINIVNKLYDAMLLGKGKSILKDILKELVDYANYHFETEEKIFKKYNYPKSAEHTQIHSEFKKQVYEIKENFDQSNFANSTKVFNFVKVWVSDHILQSDKEYFNFIKDQL